MHPTSGSAGDPRRRPDQDHGPRDQAARAPDPHHTVRRRLRCETGPDEVVKRGVRDSRTRPLPRDHPRAHGPDVSSYRLVPRVRATRRNPKTYLTYTLLRGVQRGEENQP
jgi:hypothetical protein